MGRVLVTGASAGLGAAFSRAFAGRGEDLVLVARDEDRLRAAADELVARFGVEVEVLAADLATDAGMSAVEERLRAAPAIDGLVNNAGMGQQGTFLGTDLVDELTMLRLHCEAILRLTRAAVETMQAAGGGRVLSVASIGAFFPRGTYGATKAWVVSFTRGVAQDIAGSGVQVSVVCPGFVRTEFHERARMDVSNTPAWMWMDADQCVDETLRDFDRGRVVIVPRALYKVLATAGRLLPPNLTGRLSSRAARRYADELD